MTRLINLLVLCFALLALIPDAGAANAHAETGPCAELQPGATGCAEFLTYLRESAQSWSQPPSVFVPESTMTAASAAYMHQWDENDVAYVPESTMNSRFHRYQPNWDDNNVAYVPESTMAAAQAHYIPHWDDNDVAYLPESTMTATSARYVPNWDDNDVAYIPETTMDVPANAALGQSQSLGVEK